MIASFYRKGRNARKEMEKPLRLWRSLRLI